MRPIKEVGHGAGHAYADGWWGRGLVQLTWQSNYAVWGKRLGVDLTGHPALTWPVALPVLVNGMALGLFTGVGLRRYFSVQVDDPVGTRAIVNGQDRAALIAGYHRTFLAALGAAPVQQRHATPASGPVRAMARPLSPGMQRPPVAVVSAMQSEADQLNDAELARLQG